MAYVVVAIHTTTSAILGLRWVAVPFFFVISGFFLFRKMPLGREQELERIRRWTLKSLKMYLIWTAIYLPFTVYGWWLDGLTWRQCILQFSRNLLFCGENYLSWPLWYLLGMVWAGTAYYLFKLCRIPLWGVLAFSALLCALPYLFDRWPDSIFWKVFPSRRLFSAFGWISLGGGLGLLHLQRPGWLNRLFHWLPDALALEFRNASVVIYLSHMVFAGLLLIFAGLDKGWMLFCLSALGASLAAIGAALWKRKVSNP